MTRQTTTATAGPEQGAPAGHLGPGRAPGLDGVGLVRTVATALVRLSRWRDVGGRVYADGVQRAYNHLVLRAIACGGEPPASVPDMVTWAGRTPLAQWPTGLQPQALGEAGLDGGDFLVDAETRTPTQVCFEWAMAVPDVPAGAVRERGDRRGARELPGRGLAGGVHRVPQAADHPAGADRRRAGRARRGARPDAGVRADPPLL